MATAAQVKFDPNQRPVFAVPNLSADAAAAASTYLQKNHDNHHIFFNDAGFHNHIAHHLPSIYALGADAATIKHQYEFNATYQLPPKTLHADVVRDMSDYSVFKKHLGDAKHFHDYLIFFQDEIDSEGWQSVLNEWLFAGDDKADDMLTRLFGGLSHPFLHLGFGVEFEQPALIAEGLAETAVHSNALASFLFKAERAASARSSSDGKSLMALLEEIRSDNAFTSCITEADADTNGSRLHLSIDRLGDKLSDLVSQYKVPEDHLERDMKKEYELAAYYTFASQRPSKGPKIDFYFMHDMNAAIFVPRFIEAFWLSNAAKCRMLEWKARLDLVNYVARACPKLHPEEITNYVPASNIKGQSAEQQWKGIFKRANETEDDGHLPKLVRACAAGDQLWKTGGATGAITQDMWLKMGHMAVDSVLDTHPKWVRATGLDSAWNDVKSKEQRTMATL